MATKKINDVIFTSIANAIRGKLGVMSFFYPHEMASAINEIKGEPSIQPKSIYANGLYSVSEGVDGFNPVVVNVPNTYSVGDNGKVVSGASLVAQTPMSVSENGVYDTTQNNEVTVAVAGGGDITSDATLTSGSQMLSGYTAYARGSKYTGTIPMYNGSIDGGQGSVPSYDFYSGSYIITPSTVDQAFPTSGKLMSQNFQVLSYPSSGGEPYDGSYVITPSIFSQAFPTAGKLLSQDIVVEPYSIDFYSGSYSFDPSAEQIIVSTSGKTLVSDIKINAYSGSGEVYPPYTESYVVSPSWLSQTLPTSGKVMTQDLVVEAIGDMLEVTITENGVYLPADFSAYGFSSIYVQVFPNAVRLSRMKYVNEFTYLNDTLLSRASGYSAIGIEQQAFFGCINLLSVNFPVCEEIGSLAFRECEKLTTMSFPMCETIGKQAFWSCYSLASADFPLASMVDGWAFLECSSLSQVSFPSCTYIGSYAFASCYSLESAIFPMVSSIESYAFRHCSSLSIASFPSCETVESYAFNGCTSLESISFPNCSYIGEFAFNGCNALVSIDLPSCASIGSVAFAGAPIQDISLPLCETINSRAFEGCSVSQLYLPELLSLGNNAFNSVSTLEQVSISKCTYIGSYAFADCINLSKAITKASYIGNFAFGYCSVFSQLYILNKFVVAELGNNAFADTPIESRNGTVYVPSVIYSSYQNDSHWWNYNVVSMTDAEIGELLS